MRSVQQSDDHLLRVIISLAVALGVLHVVVALVRGQGPVLPVLSWYVPTVESFGTLAALSVAFLAFGRYRVQREPVPFWIGLAFSSYAVSTVFNILSFPGLLPGQRGLIADLPNTSAWLGTTRFVLPIFLSIAAVARWPRNGMPGERRSFKDVWLALATLMAVIAIASLLVVFELYLPLLVVDGESTPLRIILSSINVIALAVGAALAAHRYRQTGEVLLGYASLAMVLLGFSGVAGLIGARRFTLLWYWLLLLIDTGLAVMLFGLLSEYVGLFRRERDKTRELELLREEAQRRAAELEGILENMADSVFVIDTKGRITLANESGIRLLGMTSLEEAQRDVGDLARRFRLRDPDGTPISPEGTALMRALTEEAIVQEDAIMYSPLAQRDIYIHSSAAPIRDQEGRVVGAVAITRDVTELTELDRLKDQFLSVAAHELKTPVTAIKGYAQLLIKREYEGVSPRGLKALEAINRQSDRISRLVNELLEISRLQTGRLELHLARLDLSRLAAEAVERMKIATEKHRLLFQSPGPVFVNADSDRIEQVLYTLLDNAIKFSPQGGVIETSVRSSLGRVDGEAVVSVQDHGVGIPRDRQARIFELFYRAHSGTPYDYGGMGVGLFISMDTIIRHGGRMWLESEEGKGSVFYFTLPLA